MVECSYFFLKILLTINRTNVLHNYFIKVNTLYILVYIVLIQYQCRSMRPFCVYRYIQGLRTMRANRSLQPVVGKTKKKKNMNLVVPQCL